MTPLTDPRDMEGVEAVAPAPAATPAPSRGAVPPPPRPTEVHRVPPRPADEGPVERPPAPREEPPQPRRGRKVEPPGETPEATSPLRVRLDPGLRARLEQESSSSGRSFGIITYEAVVLNIEELRRRLRTDQPVAGMPPVRRARYYVSGGSPKVDLYLSPEERRSVVALAAELQVRVSVLLREALMLRFP